MCESSSVGDKKPTNQPTKPTTCVINVKQFVVLNIRQSNINHFSDSNYEKKNAKKKKWKIAKK